MVAVSLLLLRQQRITAISSLSRGLAWLTPTQHQSRLSSNSAAATPQLGPRHQLNYDQWLEILKQEAQIATTNRPEHLTILLGDSLSLWFPADLLPHDRNWLNQGISGETTAGLLRRLELFDSTRPEVIFLMIGINDLIRGESDRTILANQRQIIQYLQRVHPNAKIIVQSILPHSDTSATWESKDKLLAIPNDRIRQLNQQLQQIATAEGAKYLNLHPLFINNQGNLRPELSTDGLHLNPQGYLVWRSALQTYSQIELKTP